MPALLAVLAAAFSRLIGSRAGHWIVSAALWLGISFASYQVVLDPAMALIQQYMSETGAEALAALAFLNVDKAVTMLFSAYAARLASRLVLRRRTV
ncbi:MAG: DUF2523 domain-containing protein [Rhodospirillaceae bacterium]|nr:DUF2523 domain-containing protein [Rhodospirillaceae bacterium]